MVETKGRETIWLAVKASLEGNRLSSPNAVAPVMNASGGRLPPGVIR